MDPVHVAEVAASRDDHRLVAVYELAIEVPGVNDEELIRRLGYVVLEGTSDAPQDTSCEQYQEEATSYARRYNRRMMELVARMTAR